MSTAIYHDIEQRSAEWFALRCGIPTASCFSRIITAKTQKPSSQAVRYAHDLLAERILGQVADGYESPYMARGQEIEDQAIAAYEFDRDMETSRIGFVTNWAGRIGASPDRLVGSDGLLEMKAPGVAAVHIGRMLDNGALDDEHRCQVQGQLFVSDREWCDVMSYHPALPPVIVRAHRDDKLIQLLGAALATFVDLLDELQVRLEREYGPFVKVEAAPPAPVDGDLTDSEIDSYVTALHQRGEWGQ